MRKNTVRRIKEIVSKAITTIDPRASNSGQNVQASRYTDDEPIDLPLDGVDGDIIIYNGGWTRLAKAANDKILTLVAGFPSWEDNSPVLTDYFHKTNDDSDDIIEGVVNLFETFKSMVTSGSSNQEFLDDLINSSEAYGILKSIVTGGGGAEYLDLKLNKRIFTDFRLMELISDMLNPTFTNLGFRSYTVTSPTAAADGTNTRCPGVVISNSAFSNVASIITDASTTYFEWENIAGWSVEVIDNTVVRLWNVLAANDPSGADTANLDLYGFRFSTGAGDTNWQLVTQDVSGNRNVVDSGVAVNANTVYLLQAIKESSNVRFYINGVYINTINTNLPTVTTSLRMCHTLTSLTGSPPYALKKSKLNRMSLAHI